MADTVRSIMAVAPTVGAVLGLPPLSAATERPIDEISGSLEGLSRIAVLAPDALGLSVWKRWRETMLFLTSLHGTHHLVLRSVEPTITPVNFATLVTGAAAEVHGVRDRQHTIACQSLFDLVREAGGKSVGAGQPGYTGGEFLARHADLSGRTDEASDDAVTETVIALAREHRPQFIIAQLGETDTTFHHIGPSSPDAEQVIRATDERLRLLVGELTALHYGVIVLADHGQHDAPNTAGAGMRGDHDGSRPDEDGLVPCTWTR